MLKKKERFVIEWPIDTARNLCKQVEENSVEYKDIWFAAEETTARKLDKRLQQLRQYINTAMEENFCDRTLNQSVQNYIEHRDVKERLERAGDTLSGISNRD